MNDKFDELAKSLAQSVTRRQALKRFGVGLSRLWPLAAGLAFVGLPALPAEAQVALGPPVEISFPNPLGACDDGLRTGSWTLQDAAEPSVAVNPLNPKNIVVAWMGGIVQSIITAASFDGGATWQKTALPITLCAGGPYVGAGDPWLSFAPNGDLYASGVMGNSFSATLLGVCKSTDGGLHWSPPAIVSRNNNPDKPTIAADPADPRFVYATWSQSSPTKPQFARSTDGGLTWGLQQSVSPTTSAGSCQVVVLPDGTLVEFFVENSKLILHTVRSTDRGQTWSSALNAITMTPVPTFDPEQGQSIRAPEIPSYAVDPQSGDLYVVWADGRFSNFQYNDIAFSMSADGGFTWSLPIRINQTPLNVAPANRQAFIPIIAVAANGTIGISYYDFRFNDPSAGLLSDCWLVQCHPSATTDATNPANWGGEVPLTASSFDLEAALNWFGLFIGDYEGLAATGNGFIAAFGAVDQNGVTSVFSRRVGQ